MKSSCVFAVLLLLVALPSAIHGTDVPVFIWGKPSVTYVPALSRYATSEFGALIESQTDEHTFTLIFAEDRLSTEDLSQCKLNTQTCFRNLAKLSRKSYLPNVNEPLQIFQQGTNEIQSVQISADGTLSERIVPKGGAIAVVNFDGDDFASHDALIDSLYNKLRAEFGNILAVYTGKTPSFRYSKLIRRTRQAAQAPDVPKILTVENIFLMAYEKFAVGAFGKNLSEVTLEKAEKNDTGSSETTLQIDIKGASGPMLSLNFLLAQGSWEIVRLTYDSEQYYLRHRVHINQHFSYHCNSLQYYTHDMKKQIIFGEVQLQPYWPTEGRSEFKRFGDSWDCVGFTSPGILTGLFLVAIFIFIGAYGIVWMMDIRTMDRFDDPKGKTIIVTAAD
ncbi:V-type proton ATPase subunit S1 [Toxorhynchites rutilus septentrionalis]|uniref:V-type proton ATPase subunit S1 n=1 Tax=Toxorhynchites rutilus septentrionalis TaxID=329112 RepID=UPI002479DDE7|nr:V-type proton ATPase subunit S1 [Toxorhynchites rutilus septentrionalis]